MKIADLELGIVDNTTKKQDNRSSNRLDGNDTVDRMTGDVESGRNSNSSSSGTEAVAAVASAGRRRQSVDVDCMLGNWLAPEVLQNGQFIQASDIYALGKSEYVE